VKNYQGVMTHLSSVAFKDGSSIESAQLYYKDQGSQIYIKESNEKDKNTFSSSSKRYSMVWCSPDQVLKSSTLKSDFKPLAWKDAALEHIQKKAQKTAQSRQLQLLRLSGQIDEFAMRLFMSLSKTVPCKWYFEERTIKEPRAAFTAIVVFDELVINPPYNPEDFFVTPEASPATVEWIGKMVAREREKLKSINQ
jgi:hypothetical protein